MDVAGYCRQAHVVVVAGKGGVGKTTVACALGLVAAQTGLDVLLVGLDDSLGIPALFGSHSPLGYTETTLAPTDELPCGPGRVRSRVITSDEALLEYLADHGLRRVANRLVANGALEVIATAIPGIREVLVLGKLKQLEVAGTADLIIVDAPATGHAMSLLTSSSGLLDAARGGPLRAQAEAVVELLSDPARCAVSLVTIPEETPVNELIEAAYRIEDEIGVKLGTIVVNACFPQRSGLEQDPADAARRLGLELDASQTAALAVAGRLGAARQRVESEQLARLNEAIALPQLRLPSLFRADLGPHDLARLAHALRSEIAEL